MTELSVLDGAIADFDAALGERTCRWCAGDGLDPFLPTRVRQWLGHTPYLVYKGGRNASETFSGLPEREGTLLFSAVTHYCPLNEWLNEEVSPELRGRSDVVYTPFDLIGMSYMRIRCKRCRGTGRTTRLVV